MVDRVANCVSETIAGQSGDGDTVERVLDCSVASKLYNSLAADGVLVQGDRYPYSFYHADGTTVGIEHGWGTWDDTAKELTCLAADVIDGTDGPGVLVDWAAGDKILEITLTESQVFERDGGTIQIPDPISFGDDALFPTQIDTEIVIVGLTFGASDTYVIPSVFSTTGLLAPDPLNHKFAAAASGEQVGVVGPFSSAAGITPNTADKGMLYTTYKMQGRRTDTPADDEFYSATGHMTSNFHTTGTAKSSVYNSLVTISDEVDPSGVAWTTEMRRYVPVSGPLTDGVGGRNQVIQHPSKSGETWYWEVQIEAIWVSYA